MKILFLSPYPLNEAPSQRFRFEQYFKALSNLGHSYTLKSFLNSKDWKIFYQSGKATDKLLTLLLGFIKRFFTLFQALRYDFIFIHRELAPVGPPVLEWILAKILRKKIIFDFDDAIWLTDKTNESVLEKTVRWRGKVSLICRWSYKVSCGNDYLAEYAQKFNKNVIVNPTTIDITSVDQYLIKLTPQIDREEVVIGWTGSHSTLKYLLLLEPVLQQLEKELPQIRFVVIADQPPNLKLKRLTFIKWNKESEVKDLSQITIGIMPLPDDEWSKGKCGFKALQYMALCIPAVVSPVGVNSKIINHGKNGLLATTDKDWIAALQMLTGNSEERKRLGQAGRKTVEELYSVSSNEANFLSLFS